MKTMLALVLVLFAAVGIAVLMLEDPGYVLITVGQWTIETSVVVLATLGLVGFAVSYLVVRYTFRLLRLPRDLRRARTRRRAGKAQNLLGRGLALAAEGRWDGAESAFSRGAALSEQPVLHYLEAARAAQRLGAPERRDRYLEQARRLSGGETTLMSALSLAELLLEDHKPEEAREALESVRGSHPNHPRLLELLACCYAETGNWDNLRSLAADLRRRRAVPAEQVEQYKRDAWAGLLREAGQRGDLERARAIWKEIPRALRQDEKLLITYSGVLRDNDAGDEAADLIRDALRRQWSDVLAVGYGEIGRGSVPAQLTTAEGWLKQHPENPHLLLTLGRLAHRAQQLEKARDYLEHSIRLQPNPDAYEELGEVLESLDDARAATRCFRRGMRLLSGRPEVRQADAVLPARVSSG